MSSRSAQMTVATKHFPFVSAFGLNRMNRFAFCGLSDVQLSSNGPCICFILSFPICPNNVIRKSTSDAYIYNLMLTISHAGYTIRKAPVLHDLRLLWPQFQTKSQTMLADQQYISITASVLLGTQPPHTTCLITLPTPFFTFTIQKPWTNFKKFFAELFDLLRFSNKQLFKMTIHFE